MAGLTLRPYQQAAVDSTIKQLRSAPEPCLIDASVSAGKTFIVAGLMSKMEQAGRSALCLTMTAELVEQNSACYAEHVARSSVMCAALGKKTWQLPAVFGTPQTVWSAIKRGHGIAKRRFDLLVVDEAHNILAATYQNIIDHLRSINPAMRIVGMTGTPYRGKGVPIFGADQFFPHVTANIGMKWLVENGFVVPCVYGSTCGEAYDYSNAKLMSNGKYRQSDLAAAAEGHGRLTAEIVADVVAKSQDQGGVLIFAATVDHCKEVLASLPKGISAMLTGETPEKERAAIVKAVKNGDLKYVVNVNVLTVGFSAPVISHVVWLRPTESAVLWVQGCGRGVRMAPGKTHCLVSDYAGNLDRLGDVDDPVIIDMVKANSAELPKDVPCPECGELNTVSARRCIGVHNGERCGFFFDWKECPQCGAANDSTARKCRCCDGELIDPNSKLDRRARVRIGPVPVSVPVLNVDYSRHVKRQTGDESLRVDYLVTMPSGDTEIISEWCKPSYRGFADRFKSNEIGEVLAHRHTLPKPTGLLVHKRIGEKYLSIVMREYQ